MIFWDYAFYKDLLYKHRGFAKKVLRAFLAQQVGFKLEKVSLELTNGNIATWTTWMVILVPPMKCTCISWSVFHETCTYNLFGHRDFNAKLVKFLNLDITKPKWSDLSPKKVRLNPLRKHTHLGYFDQLIIIIMPIEERFLAEYLRTIENKFSGKANELINLEELKQESCLPSQQTYIQDSTSPRNNHNLANQQGVLDLWSICYQRKFQENLPEKEQMASLKHNWTEKDMLTKHLTRERNWQFAFNSLLGNVVIITVQWILPKSNL